MTRDQTESLAASLASFFSVKIKKHNSSYFVMLRFSFSGKYTTIIQKQTQRSSADHGCVLCMEAELFVMKN